MNRIIFTLLMISLVATTWGQGLGSAGGGTYYGPAPAAGEHVPGQLVMHLSSPIVGQTAQTSFGNKLPKDASLVALSPKGNYALIQVPVPTGERGNACYLIGEGNNLLSATGEGDEIDLNYLMGTDYTDNGRRRNSGYANYEVNADCSDEYPVIPEITGGNARVRIGVIDGGVYARYGQTYINGVVVNQTVFSQNGSTNYSLRPWDYSDHGRSILALISGTFRSQNLHDRLTLESYRVMDANLRATVFDVASAIEFAALDGRRRPQILSISIGFKPASCSEYYAGQAAENSILREAIKTAQQYGILVITSAGNDGASLDNSPQYPAVEDDVFTNIITVGSLGCDSSYPSVWSNFSSSLVDFLTVGESVNIIDGSYTHTMTGTSFSTPVVAAKAGFHIAEMSSPSYPFRPTEVLCALYQQTVPGSGSFYGIIDASAYRGQYCPTVNPGGGFTGTGGGPTLGGGPQPRMAISPNPMNSNASIQLSEDVGEATLSIMDANGKVIKNQAVRPGAVDLNLHGLRAGIYMVSLQTSTGVITKRVVKR